MKSYLRFALREYLPYFGGVGVIVLGHLLFYPFDSTFVLPGGGHVNIWVSQLFVLGMLFGVVNAVWDECRGTLDYTSHRGIDHRSQLWAHHVVAVPGLLVMVAASIGAWLGISAWIQPNFSAVPTERIVALGALATTTVAGYGLGFWVGSWPIQPIVRVLIGLATLVGWVGVTTHWRVPSAEQWTTSAPFFVVGQLAFGLTLILAGQHLASLKRDPDAKLPTSAVLVHVILASLLISLCISRGGGRTQRTNQMRVWADYPIAVRMLDVEPPSLALLSNNIEGVDGFVEVDEHHRPLSYEATAANYEILFSPWMLWTKINDPIWERSALWNRSFAKRGLPFEGVRERLCRGESEFAFLDRATGEVEVLRLAGGGRSRGERVVLGRGAKERPFSHGAQVLGEGSSDQPILIFEPTDQTVWRFSMSSDEATLEPCPLPNNDAVVSCGATDGNVAVEGSRGVYVWQGLRFEEISTDAGEAILAARDRHLESIATTLARRRAVEDPLRFDISFEGDGLAETTVSYRPRTETERSTEQKMVALSALRAPVVLLASHLGFFDPSRPLQLERCTFVDPMFLDGNRRPELMGILGLMGFLSLIAAMRMWRLGVPLGRVALWVATIAMFGIPAFALSFVIETRRAWWGSRGTSCDRPVEIPTSSLLIESA